MQIKKLFFIICLFATSICFAENYCSEANDLGQQIFRYNCPQRDTDLALLLTGLANDANFVSTICSANSKDCTTGVYAFVEEAKGLATIVKKGKSSYCYIASEDSAQLLWYTGNYLLRVC